MQFKKFYIVLICLLVFTLEATPQQDYDSTNVEVSTQANAILDSVSTSEEESIDALSETSTSEDTNVLRTISTKSWDNIIKDKSFTYTPNKERKKKENKPLKFPAMDWLSIFFNATVFKTLAFLIVGFILVFVLYKLFFDGEFNFFKRRKKIAATEQFDNDVNLESFTEWDLALRDALYKQDYRLATRVLYLQTLQELNQKSLIQFEQEKTNWDYVNELNATNYATDFALLTRYFDYVWYGHFEINHAQYVQIETLFRNFQKQIIG